MNLVDNIFALSVISQGSPPLINIGCGQDLTVRELVNVVADVVGFHGKVTWDRSKPDGTPCKVLDISRLTDLGWKSKTELSSGIRHAYQDYLSYSSDALLSVS